MFTSNHYDWIIIGDGPTEGRWPRSCTVGKEHSVA